MRKLVTWLVVSLGIAALVRKLRKREEPAELAPVSVTGEDPADELRRKLAETRTEDQPEATEATEEQPEAPPAAETSVEDRRAGVYEQGRATLDEMRQPEES